MILDALQLPLRQYEVKQFGSSLALPMAILKPYIELPEIKTGLIIGNYNPKYTFINMVDTTFRMTI